MIELTDEQRIYESRNRVFISNFAIGKNSDYAMSTKEGFVYRNTGVSQIKDILECGYVRPKNGKIKGNGNINETCWSAGGPNLYYMDQSSFIIEVPAEIVPNNSIGAVPLSALTGIWVFNQDQKRYINMVEYYKKAYNDIHADKEESSRGR